MTKKIKRKQKGHKSMPKKHPDILTSEISSDITKSILKQKPVTIEQAKAAYPRITLTATPTHDTSLAAQVRRQFKNNLAWPTGNNIYRLILSKNTTVMDKPELDKALAPLGLKPHQIQYIGQNNHDIIVNLTVSPYFVKKFKKEAN